MLFLPPNQQHQSTEGSKSVKKTIIIFGTQNQSQRNFMSEDYKLVNFMCKM